MWVWVWVRVCVCVCVGVKGVYPTKSWMEGYRICKMLNQRELKRIFTEVCTGWTGFPSSSVVKNLPAMQEMQVWSLGQGDPLEEGMATHSTILAWTIPCTEEPGGLQSMRLQRVIHDWSDWARKTVYRLYVLVDFHLLGKLKTWHQSYPLVAMTILTIH